MSATPRDAETRAYGSPDTRARAGNVKMANKCKKMKNGRPRKPANNRASPVDLAQPMRSGLEDTRCECVSSHRRGLCGVRSHVVRGVGSKPEVAHFDREKGFILFSQISTNQYSQNQTDDFLFIHLGVRELNRQATFAFVFFTSINPPPLPCSSRTLLSTDVQSLLLCIYCVRCAPPCP
jgi:hypothetical protein